MQMVLSAVLTNASEAIDEEGYIKISTRNVVVDDDISKESDDLSTSRAVVLEIEDNGRGMDETTRRRLFDPFFTTKVHGRGLGMAAVYGIIKNHDGRIKVDSKLGQGTRVSIYLPACEEAPSPDKKTGACLDPGQETILLVEDEDVVGGISKEILSRLGYRIVVAKTGREAVDISNSDELNFDLVLLDMKLPDSNGKHVFSAIKDARPDVKVILFSGFSIDGPVQDILDSGADGFVQKPFSVSTLSAKIREVLG